MKNLCLSYEEVTDLLFAVWSEIMRLEKRLNELDSDEDDAYYEVESNLARYKSLRNKLRNIDVSPDDFL